MHNDFEVPDVDCPIPEPFRTSAPAVLTLTGMFYLTFVSRIIFAPLMPYIRDELKLTGGQAGAVFLMVSVGLFTAPLVVGWLSRLIKYHGTLVLANIGLGLALGAISFMDGLAAMHAALILLGLSTGLHIPSAVASITAQVQKPDWGKALGIHQLAPPLSFVTAPLIVTALSPFWSWRVIIQAWAGLSILFGLIFLVRGGSGRFPGQPLNLSVAREILSRRSFWVIVILLSMAMSGTAGIYSMLPLYLINNRGFDPQTANTLIGLSQITGLVMVFFAGVITDRIGPKRTIALALSGAGVLTIFIGTLHGFWLAAAIFLQPLFVTSFFPAAFAALSSSVRPRQRGMGTALGPAFAFLIGGGLMPALIGSLAEVWSFAAGIIFAGCYILIGPFLSRLLELGQFDDEEGC